MKRQNYFVRYFFILLSLFFINNIFGQGSGKIVGVVTDANSGETIPGASVIVKGTFMGASTDVDGYYFIVNVPVGTYELEAQFVGYKTVTKTDVVVSLDQIAEINFEIEEAVLEGETVVVTAERDVLNQELSNSQIVITPVQIENAAGINTMNEFLGAQAGITDERTLTIRGGSAEQTGSLVNGLNFVNVRIGKAEATIPFSAVEQVSLQAGGYGAEYGNYRSGLINYTTKTGEKDNYHFSINMSAATAEQKRFGKSLYDPTNYFLKPFFDPFLAFNGTSPENWAMVENVDEETGAYLNQNYQGFRGWLDLTDRYNRGLDPEDQATPMDLYLYNAWMHMIVPDFNALEEMYPEYTITEEQKAALKKHAHKKEGRNNDYNVDIGFGGPIPFFSKQLGDATFHISHKTTDFNYIQPVMRDGEMTNVTLLTLQSHLSKALSLKVTGLYRFIRGSQSNFPTDGDVPDLNQGGDTMPISNLATLLGSGPNAGGNSYGGALDQYAYHPTFWQPKDQSAYLSGMTLNYTVNPKTFMELTMSYAYQQDLFKPKETRDRTPIINFGPFWVDEMPYGITFGPDTVFYDPNDRTKFFAPGEYESAYQISRRFASKVGQFHENSVTQQFKFKFDFNSQFNRYNFFKSGLELNYFDIDNDNWRWWKGHDTLYEMRDQRTPYQFGTYIQDQITLDDMKALVGVRFDYYNSGGGVWPTGDPYQGDAFEVGEEKNDKEQLYADLLAGVPVIWRRWHAIDDALDGTFLEKTKNHFTVSPRLGVSFPITERSKFWFNYGHYRQPVPYSQQFFYKIRFEKQGIYELGNPNLEPPRTISYELGVSYNLLDQYLIEASTYYKDVSGEAARVQYRNGSTITYNGWLNNRWEDNTGFELKVTKNYGTYLTGWLNFWYVIDKNGNVGSQTVNQDASLNTVTSLYNGDENSPSLNPRAAANISLHTPDEFGDKMAGFYPFGGWTLSFLPRWEQGPEFTFNPAGIRNVSNNMRWPDIYKLDLKLTKNVNIYGYNISAYLNVKNVFNTKISWLRYGWPFSGESDLNNYLSSLHLPEYKNRRVFPDEETYIAGNDEIGDMRSSSKSYINDPDIPMFAYGEPREIWFGLRFNF